MTSSNRPEQRPLPSRHAPWSWPTTSGLRETAFAIITALAIAAPILALGAFEVRAIYAARAAAAEAAMAYERVITVAALPTLPTEAATHGRDLFTTTCVACHGATGSGVRGLGRNLVESDFVAGLSDTELLRFLNTGRPSTPVAMPAKGGRDDLTDSDLRDLIVYLRGLQDPRRLPELPAMVVAAPVPPTDAEKAAALSAAGGDAELAGFIASGTKLYATTCIACHGAGGAGIKGNGKVLANNEFVRSLDDDQLLAFVKSGRDPGDPKNTTGVAMPPKGGNPALSDDDLLDIIAYLRTLQPSDKGARTSAK